MVLTEKDARLVPAFRILKNITYTPNELTIDEFARFYRSKYEKMKDIILDRVQKKFVSLNKLGANRDEVFVMGMVRDLRTKDETFIIDLEDPTACIPIVFDKPVDVELDDVVAVRAISARDVLFGKQVIFPDVPLRQPKRGVGRLCILSDLRLDEAPRQDADRLFSWLSFPSGPSGGRTAATPATTTSGRDLGDLFSAPADDVFMVKLAWWIGR